VELLPDGKRSDLFVSPFNPALEERKGLPPALLREKSEAYGCKLMQVGVPVTSTRYDGTIHDFAMQNALADAWDAKSAICQATDTGGRHMPVQPSQ